MISYASSKCPKQRFRSIIECSYAMLLDSLQDVKNYDYEVTRMIYYDGFVGKRRTYICDFRIVRTNGLIENVEVKSANQQTYGDKYLYAKNQIQGWRFITDDEFNNAIKLFSRPGLPVKFDHIIGKYRHFTWWAAKDESIPILPEGCTILDRQLQYKYYYKYHIINHNIEQSANVALELNTILDLIKQNYRLGNIAKKFKTTSPTIIKFLEDRSYVIEWGRYNKIKYATKLIWPSEPDKTHSQER